MIQTSEPERTALNMLRKIVSLITGRGKKKRKGSTKYLVPIKQASILILFFPFLASA